MKRNPHYAVAALAIVVGCVHIPDSGTSRCLSERVRDSPPLKDVEREMCLAAPSGSDLEYWIDGERLTPGCDWHLTHLECQLGSCLYRCRETEALWRLSNDGNAVMMTKVVEGTTLQQTYRFEEQSNHGH